MVTESMTYEEIWKEIKKDFSGIIWNKIEEGNKRFRKKIIATTVSRVVRLSPMYFQSSITKLNYCLMLYCLGKQDFKRNSALFNLFAYFYKDYGLYAFFPTGKRFESLSVYTPHFFDRYQERFLKDSSLKRTEVMQIFFLNNYTGVPITLGNEKYPNFVFLTSKDGVQLGLKYSSDILELKTFLSQEQLKGDQINIDNENYKKLQKYFIKNFDIDVMLE